jgi:hypothetical protein
MIYNWANWWAPLRRCQRPYQMMHNTPYGNHTDPICGWLDVNARGGHLQGRIVFSDVLPKRYGGWGEVCTRGMLKSEQVPQWLKRRNGEDDLTSARFAFSTAKVCVSPGSLIRPNHNSALLALSCPTPYVKHRNTGLIKFWKGDAGCCVQSLLTPRLLVTLAVAVPLLLSSCSGHAVHIIPLAVNGRQLVPGGGVHKCLISNGDSRVHVLHVKLHISIFHWAILHMRNQAHSYFPLDNFAFAKSHQFIASHWDLPKVA